MEVRDGSSDQDARPGGGTPSGMGQAGRPLQENNPTETKPAGAEDRTGQTPEITEKVIPIPNRRFNPYRGIAPKSIKVGYPCLHCPHAHVDHGMYNDHLCLIEGCNCVGLRIDHKLIPSKIGD